MMTLTTIGYRYEILGQIGRGAMGAVYRVKDRTTGKTIALKRVTGRTGELVQFPTAFDFRLSLAHEFRTLASLRHPNIVNVYEYGFDVDELPYFTMELLADAQPLRNFIHESVETRVDLLVQILQALTYLHRHGIIHRDLKPGNVLVDQHGRVKLLDFGVATKRQEATIAAGTLAYVAPEILQGAMASEAADLYAVGVLAYELLAGTHPYDVSNMDTLRREVLEKKVDTSHLQVDDEEQARRLGSIIGRLLNKLPDNRYPTAWRVIRALCEAIGKPIPIESQGIRDSFLQAAKFIGREQELTTLNDALVEALNGHGSAWVIYGEYGVGKSRLLEELRVKALVEGATVLYGVAPEGGGLPYHPWRTIVRHLLLYTDVNDFEAGVLKEIIPDIDSLLDREVADVTRLEARDQQQRLALTITNLFTRQDRQLLVVLENMHWLNESLIPLQALCEVLKALPVMVVGSFDSEEAPHLAEKLPLMHPISLKRFSEFEVEQVAASVMGESARRPELLQLLTRETDGNAYFLVEVMRTLAEKAGHLDAIGQMDLPERVLPMGMMDVAQRRLNRLTATAQPMLQVAAVIGRELNFAILRRIDNLMDYDQWLLECSEAGILEYSQGRWRFTHEMMREGVLHTLDETYRTTLHAAVAEAIEALYPDNPDYASILVEHWHQAGNAEREAYYALIAANQYWALNSFQRMKRICQRARASLETAEPDSYHLDYLLHLTYWQAQAHFRLGEIPLARQLFAQAATLAVQAEHQPMHARILRALAATISLEGDYATAQTLAEDALGLALHNGDQLMIAEILGLSLGPIMNYRGDFEAAWNYSSQALDILQDNGEQWQIARLLANMAEIARLQGRYDESRTLIEQSQHIAQRVSDHQVDALGIKVKGDLAGASKDFGRAFMYYGDAIAVFRAIHEPMMVAITLADQARVRLRSKLNGNSMNIAKNDLRQALEITQTMQVPTLTVRVLLGVAMYYAYTRHAYWAAELMGSLSQYPIPGDLMQEWNTLRSELLSSLSTEQFKEAATRGNQRTDLRDIAAKIILDWR
ncbi:MAG: protein kinase [Anaerolineae bacterium]|nr:protein kinase [Anaerolineae bacterium]